MIVGDGIRESVEDMVGFFQLTPQLHFTLALVELQVYELEANGPKPLLVVPQIVARTREITRAVVRVEGKAVESIRVAVDHEIPTERKPTRRYTLTEDDYFNILGQRVDQADVDFARQIIEDMQKRGCVVDWKQGSFVVKFPDPAGSGQKLSLLGVPTDGGTYIPLALHDQLRSLGLPEQIAIDFARESCQLFADCRESEKYPGSWSRPIALKELRQRYSEFASVVEKAIGSIREASSG